jgi:hypothetical protein
MKYARKSVVQSLILTAVIFFVCACESIAPYKGKESPSMNAEQAADRVDALLDGTCSSVIPGLKWLDFEATALQNSDSFTNQPDGTAIVSRTRYLRTEISKNKLGGLLGMIERYWKKSGYTIKGMNPQEPSFTAVTPDGFSITLSTGPVGNVYFDASSPDIKDPGYSGTIPGKGSDDIPTRSDVQPDLVPDVEDSFWSH